MRLNSVFLCFVLAISVVWSLNFVEKVDKRLIAFSENNHTWLTTEQIEKLPLLGETFMDITDFYGKPTSVAPVSDPIPEQVKFQEIVKPFLADINPRRLMNNIGETEGLGKFFNRYYTTEHGKASAEWLYGQYEAALKHSGRTDAKVNYFHHEWPQQSIVATIEGTDPEKKSSIVILGGHQDSTAGGATQRAPGADDDASGSSTVLEAWNVLLLGGFKPKRTLEFHAYAAEEAGLLGANEMARDYSQRGVEVMSMMQLDMSGHGSDIKMITDYTDNDLNAFSRKLIDAYVDRPQSNKICGYACSDHAAWNRVNYRSTFPHDDTNRRIHTADDLLKYLNEKQLTEFAKLGIAYCVELSLSV